MSRSQSARRAWLRASSSLRSVSIVGVTAAVGLSFISADPARGRRHQLEFGAIARRRQERLLPSRRPRHHAFRGSLSLRRLGLRQSLVQHQPHRAWRRSHRKIPGPELCRARRGWLSLRTPSHWVHYRRDALCGGAGPGLPYAELQRNRFDRRRPRSGLRFNERHGYAQRTWRTLRQSHHVRRHAAGFTGPSRLGA